MEYNKSYCQKNKLKYSEQREFIYNCLAESDTPLSAYDIIHQMTVKEQKNINPPTVYRAINFLLDNGFIHKIDSLKAYIACKHKHSHNGVCFVKCKSCDNIHDHFDYPLPAELASKLKNLDIQEWQLEVKIKNCTKCA